MKTHFGINVDDDHTCLERLLEVFVAGSRADAAQCRINTLDVTKVSSHRDYPLFTVGRIALDRNPEKLFRGFSRIERAVEEQAALRHARHGVCGIEARSRARTSSCSTSKRDQTEALADDLCIKYGS
jgi:Catalase